jgi:hypothetical protein
MRQRILALLIIVWKYIFATPALMSLACTPCVVLALASTWSGERRRLDGDDRRRLVAPDIAGVSHGEH